MLNWIAALVGVMVGAALSSILSAARRSRAPTLHMAATAFNAAVTDRCPTLTSVYKSAWFLANGHVESIFAWAFRRSPRLKYYRRCLPLTDGGIVALDFPITVPGAPQQLQPDAPVLLILPGLTGGSHDSYPQYAAVHAAQQGFRTVVFNPRGTSGSPVTTPQFYSASYTEDLRAVVRFLASLYPAAPLTAAGYSLGANILVRYLGEEGARTPLSAAVSLCNPFDLAVANKGLSRGFSRMYDRSLALSLKQALASQLPVFRGYSGKSWDLQAALRARTIREYDDALTIHVFGWKSTDDYYAGSASADSIPGVQIPLLCIQAADDPIAPEAAIPYAALESNPSCILALTSHGGHLGWVRPGKPFSGPWTDAPMLEFLDAVLALKAMTHES